MIIVIIIKEIVYTSFSSFFLGYCTSNNRRQMIKYGDRRRFRWARENHFHYTESVSDYKQKERKRQQTPSESHWQQVCLSPRRQIEWKIVVQCHIIIIMIARDSSSSITIYHHHHHQRHKERLESLRTCQSRDRLKTERSCRTFPASGRSVILLIFHGLAIKLIVYYRQQD